MVRKRLILSIRCLWMYNRVSRLIKLTPLSRAMAANANQSKYEVKFQALVECLGSLAPISLAGKWDNVGLLVEPSNSKTKMVKNIFLTNDLTESVLNEALEKQSQFIISYHPPIFVPLKRLCSNNWKQRIIVKCIENGIGVYSPHTALDAVNDGVNDWLIRSLKVSDIKPIEASNCSSKFTHRLIYTVSNDTDGSDLETLKNSLEVLNKQFSISLSTNMSEINVLCNEKDLPVILSNCETKHHIQVLKTDNLIIPNRGMGRIGNVSDGTTIKTAVEMIKEYLGLEKLRIALAKDHSLETTIKKVAVCAGSGSSVLRGVKADLMLSGEMSHHEVLDFVHNGSTVILCEHSNTERGFLGHFKDQIMKKFQGVSLDIHVSINDADPLKSI